MPRSPRLDTPVDAARRAPGIERRQIFENADDYEGPLQKLDGVLPEPGVACL